MYVLKTYKTRKIKLDDGSEPQKTTFEKIVFCKNKKELDQFLKGSISTIACWFGKNELYTTICELENLDLKPFLNGVIIYNTENPNGKIQDFQETEITYNLGNWYTKSAIKEIESYNYKTL